MVFIAAFDVHIVDNLGKGAIVFYDTCFKKVVHSITNKMVCNEPYIAGQLAKRELPFFTKLWERRIPSVDYIFVDGNGRYHPEKNGLACQIAKTVDCPVIGISKNKYTFPGITVKGDDIIYQNEVVAKMLCVNSKNPVYVSIGGGNITLDHAVELVKSCSRFRICEPIRFADQLSRKK